ncbi:MAG: hypothetical protein WCY80_04315 [Candidatus Izemoplasmatales bacterium]|jgi:uncharacterized membrane protein
MKNNIKRNVIFSPGEEVYKEFPKLKARDYLCQIIITNKRLIIYTYGKFTSNKRKVKIRGMNEVERKSITNLEYYLEYKKNNFWVRFIGLIFIIAAALLAYGYYAALLNLPALPNANIIYYGLSGIILLFGLILVFRVKKTLYFKAVSGFNNMVELELKATKYNELALKYIASKFY